MNDCIHFLFCTKTICDRSCPTAGESSYLLERNDIPDGSDVFKSSDAENSKSLAILQSNEKYITVESDNTVRSANQIAYAAVCENWYGNHFHCSVYHLRFSNYIDDLQRSWGLKEVPESLEYVQIWLSTAKVLVVSNIDFMKFQDFQAQTLLNIIHNRLSSGLKTILVTPKIKSLVGSGIFFDRLKALMKEGVIKL